MMSNALDDDLYRRFRELLLRDSGIYYPEHKRADLVHNLSMVLQTTGCPDFETLYAKASEHGPLWDALLQQLTIGETYFFRNTPQFTALRQHILPELIARKRATRMLRLWSAGCATGEEPYSLAILLRDLLPDLAGWNVSILATDINTRFLQQAREGLYGNWSFRETPPPLRQRFFQREGARWRLEPAIRQMVHFAPLNLVESSYPSVANGTTALDLILCRNVTIYFDEATTRQIVDRLYRALQPGGWLVVGHTEPHIEIYHRFETHNFPGTVIYRKALPASLQQRTGPSYQTRPLVVPATAPLIDRSESLADPPTRPEQRAAEHRPEPAQRQEPETPAWESIASLLDKGDTTSAEPLIHALLHAQPDHLEGLMALARLHAGRGELEDAARYCRRALGIDILHLEAHALLGQICEQQGNLESALASYRSAVYLDPAFIPAIVGMARSWSRLRQPAESKRCYRNALHLLADLPAESPVRGLEAMTAGELRALITQQLQQIG